MFYITFERLVLMNYNNILNVFNSVDLSIGEIQTDTIEDENLNILNRIFINKQITCSCTKITKTAMCIIYDFELFSYNITFEQIKRLEKTLQMFLRKESVVISPSKVTIGFTVSVPHDNKLIIPLGNCLKQTMDSSQFEVPLGLDEQNNPINVDISKLPHLLVSGTTGSGKSVCINNIIVSLLSKNKPEDLQLILIDPKQVEFAKYDSLKYFLNGRVITNVFQAANALYKICCNMDLRYREISRKGCKTIDEYNEISEKKYSRAIIVIDELADLMIRNKKEVEPLLVRIAQLGRACGIHLILATQRPSREVITGLIKVNIPAKICFKVPSSVNSRVVLDKSGAEKLTGYGDGLFQNNDGSDPVRFQGAYISSQEIDKFVEYINQH